MSTDPKKSKDELIRENAELRVRLEGLRAARATSNTTAILKELIKYGIPGYFFFKAVEALAGKMTYVDASIDGALDVCGSLVEKAGEVLSTWAALLVFVMVMVAALLSNSRLRKLNRNLARRIGVQVKRREEESDPQRSSSGLATDGQTNEKDEA